MILGAFGSESILPVLKTRITALGDGMTVGDHLKTPEGRREVYRWAQGLTGGACP
jgi:hypothetical protein